MAQVHYYQIHVAYTIKSRTTQVAGVVMHNLMPPRALQKVMPPAP